MSIIVPEISELAGIGTAKEAFYCFVQPLNFDASRKNQPDSNKQQVDGNADYSDRVEISRPVLITIHLRRTLGYPR